MKNVLKELYQGNIAPCDRQFQKGGNFHKIVSEVAKQEEQLRQMMSKKENKIFMRYDKAHSKMIYLEGEDAFIQGFQLGMKMAIEVLYQNKEEFSNISG